MSSDTAIRIRGLSKAYTIHHNHEKPSTLAEAALARLRNPLHRPRKETFYALKDIDLDIQRGDVVGIIGRNGAGKSTLLKVLSRITEPTAGQIEILGRVGSLLEVGTGFHPELTGRENIYLNGSILGMRKKEIDSQFDAIVDFAGVEQFLDTPVKRYSSGMAVRLAFAVAAHLRTEILIVDEVLAVGDAAFQNRCLGKMQSVAHSGRTVLFVSHNQAAIESLCTRSMLLVDGSVDIAGSTSAVLDRYSHQLGRTETNTAAVGAIKGVRLVDHQQEPVKAIRIGEPLSIGIDLSLDGETLRHPRIGIGIDSRRSGRVFTVHTNQLPQQLPELRGDSRLLCRCEGATLAPGEYLIKIAVGDGPTDRWVLDPAMKFTVEPSDYFGNGRLPQSDQGPVLSRSRIEVLER